MKKILTVLMILLGSIIANAQSPEDIVSWSFDVEQDGCEAYLVVTATVDEGWHVYSMNHKMEEASFTGEPTSFEFDGPEGAYNLKGGVIEKAKVHEHMDEMGRSLWIEGKGVWKQKIAIDANNPFTVNVSGWYMTCNEKGCLPPSQYSGSFQVEGCSTGSVEVEENGEEDAEEGDDEEGSEVEDAEDGELYAKESPVGWAFKAYKVGAKEYELVVRARLDSNWTVYDFKDDSDLPFEFKFDEVEGVEFEEGFEVDEPQTMTDSASGKEIVYYDDAFVITKKLKIKSDSVPVITGQLTFRSKSGDKIGISQPANFRVDLSKAKERIEDEGSPDSYLTIFFLAFLGGFAALLTPCVFPMIPMTVSFFTKQSKSKAAGMRNALTYGLSIIVIYVALGLGVTAIFGASALNALSTDVYFNIFFFLLLVVFGASFLGAFEITLPSSWVSKADKQADKGGLLGIFFMAFVLALVSFSCTGPIIGTLLVEAAVKGGMGPFFGMLGFSLALALPFALFAAFPGWLNSLPQSGGWLNSVKVVLGLLEIALAFKFLSNADLVVQAHLLEREVFLAFWIVIFSFLGFYLLGKIQFPHDSPVERVSITRALLSIFVFAFVIYMIPGMWGSPVKMLSGFLPPRQYSEIPFGIDGSPPEQELPPGAEHGPYGIPVFHHYEDALEYAKESGKPLMIDFTGHACINCRKMEDKVWVDEAVKPTLVEDVIIASLHVDEKLSLPEPIKTDDGEELKTWGGKWSHMQRTKYGAQQQPQYILLDHNEEMLNTSISYDPTIDLVAAFSDWLDDGIEEFKDRENEVVTRPMTYIVGADTMNIMTLPSFDQLANEE